MKRSSDKLASACKVCKRIPGQRAEKDPRSYGTGTVYHDCTRDRWVGAVTINGKRHKVVARTKTDASARLARELVAARATGGSVDDRTFTVSQAVKIFLERDLPSRRRNSRPLAPSTITGYRWACNIITDHLGSTRLANLTVEAVEAMYDAIESHAVTDERGNKVTGPATAATLRKLRTTLNQVINLAISRRKVSHNVATLAKLPGDAAEANERRALAPVDGRKLLKQLRLERNGLMYALSLRLGLRPGEAAAVFWEDIDGGVLHVRRGRRAVGGKVEVSNDLKTAASERSIKLPSELVEWLTDHRDSFGEVLPLHLMFPSPSGRVIDPANMQRDLAQVCRRAAVPVVKPNELRHSCASLLSDLGVPHQEIADLLGHTTTRMVDKHYRHRLRPVVDIAATADWTAERA